MGGRGPLRISARGTGKLGGSGDPVLGWQREDRGYERVRDGVLGHARAGRFYVCAQGRDQV